MKRCKRCLLPTTKPGLYFNEEGICAACLSHDHKNQINWEERRKQFEALIEQYRNPKGYDCLVPVSGGKDSTYQMHILTQVYKLRPLCVCFEPTIPTEIGRRNLDNISKLADVIYFKKDFNVYRRMIIDCFFRLGDEMWPNHVGIFTVPINFAIKFNIPLVIWGENPQQEYGGPIEAIDRDALDYQWVQEFGGLLGGQIQDLLKAGMSEKELLPYLYPLASAKNLKGIFLGHFFYWNVHNHLPIIKRLGFSEGTCQGTYWNFWALDDQLVGLHDYLRYVKFGWGRTTDHASIDIRHGLITREEGIRLVKQHDGKYPHEAISAFINYSGLPKEQIDITIDGFTDRSLFEHTNNQLNHDEQGNLVPAFAIE